ncbi:hypothetical protein DFH27DRAFT_98241 [Peziza echinospora]|nr:hypothetical protein DFH27DRAFT_98241 [Peziza echinospora]
MSGAVGSSVTPPQQSSRRGGQPPQTPVRSGSQEVHSTPGGTTWTSWLKKLVTQSVQKVAPSRRESSSNSMELVSTEDSFSSVHSSPAPEDESRLSIPGDFDSVAATSNESEIVPPKVEQRVVNPFLEVEYYNGKIINGDSSNALAFFADSLLSGGGRYSARPSARNARRASAGLSTNRPMFAPRPRFRDSVGVSSVPSSPMGYKRQRTAMNQGPMTEEMKKQIEEERAAEFQRRAEEVERERRDWRIKGQELEYEWRIIQAKLGKPIDDSEDERSESGDSVAAEKPSKGKGKEKDLGTPEKTTGQEMVKLTSSSNESTPEKTVTPPPVRSKPSSFLFGGAAYSADDAPPPPVLEKAAGEKLVAAQTPPAATASPTKKGTDSTKTSFSSDSDKENASKVLSPPATPTLSHAQLPAPLATNAPPPRRSSPTKQATMEAIHKASPIKGGASNLFGDAASKARSQAEKHKPHVSSGLRASTIMSSDSPPRTTKAAAPSFDSPAPQLKGLKPIKEIKEGDIVSQDTMYALAFEVKNHVDQMTIPHGVMLQIPLSSVKKLGMGSMARSRVEKIPTKKQQVDPLKKIILGGVGKLKKLNKA